MSKEEIFEELKALRVLIEMELRILIENNPEFCSCRCSYLVDRLQELIWKIGEDIGEF